MKSKQQSSREAMRKRRSKCRAGAAPQILQDNDDDEDPLIDISNTINQSIDGPDIAAAEHRIHSSISISSNGPLPGADEHGCSDEDALDSSGLDGDIDEFTLCYDVNNQMKLYSSCPLSIRDACFAIMKLSRRLNLDKNGIKHVLDCIRSLSPVDVQLPCTVNGLMKVIGEFGCTVLTTERILN